MSSAAYSSLLRPEPGLRLAVMGSGLLLTGAGAAAFAGLPLTPWLRWPAALVWVALGLGRCRRLWQRWQRLTAIRVYAGGELDLLTSDDGLEVGRLRAGCVVLPRAAWLCFESGSGTGVELIRASGTESEQWRRLQVICRHLTTC